MRDELKKLLSLLADGVGLDGAWRPAGFAGPDEARRALRKLAGVAAGPKDRAPRSGGLERLTVYVDGASRGNPGPSAVAAVAYLPTGELLTSSSRLIGDATNNVAEYRAVLEGLRLAKTLRARAVDVRLDSELVARQLNGVYRIKNAALRELADEVRGEAAGFGSCTFEHVSS